MTASFVRRRARVLGALAMCLAGCSASPDIVATATRPHFDGPDGGIRSTPIVECKPGRYEGNMKTDPGDGGFPVSFSGTIGFSLEKTTEKEIPVLQREAHLVGTGKDMNSSFTADIKSGLGCIAGKFETDLENGQYTPAEGAKPIPFDGHIEGVYSGDYPSFRGSWISRLHFTDGAPVVVQGTWGAQNIGP